jgi:hypothetical protein
MAVLKVERIGGLAGFGNPGAHIASRGKIDSDDLPAPDQDAVKALFDSVGKARKESGKSSTRDGFRYRISRPLDSGEETIEVPEENVPAALIRCVKDELI